MVSKESTAQGSVQPNILAQHKALQGSEPKSAHFPPFCLSGIFSSWLVGQSGLWVMQAGNEGDRNSAPTFHHVPSARLAPVHRELGNGGGMLQGRGMC